MSKPASAALLPLSVRSQFTPLRIESGVGAPLTYLDSASSALKPDVVIEAIVSHYRCLPANIHRGLYPMSEAATAAYEGARAKIARFVNAAATSEIIFTSGATDAINLLAYSLGSQMKSGDEIVITTLEHHANIVPWQMLRERKGIKLVVVPLTLAGDLDLAAFAAAIGPRTRLVAFSALSNAIGTELPVRAIVAMARRAGALTLVDAAQAITCQKVDVRAWDCDFMVFSGHKLFGPNGIGVLYGRQERLRAMSPFKGGGDMILSVTFDKTLYNEIPFKFEAGTMPIAEAVALGRAIDWLEAIGIDRIEAHDQYLVNEALSALRAIPRFRVVGEPRKRRAIISFTLAGIHPHDAGTLLAERNIAIRAGHHCAQPVMNHFKLAATIRASFSLYNQPHDIEALVDGVRHVVKVLA